MKSLLIKPFEKIIKDILIGILLPLIEKLPVAGKKRNGGKKSLIEQKASRIKLLVLDVDGVLTDGKIGINELGEEIKFYHVRDGLGLKLLIKAGVGVAIVTGRVTKADRCRAEELGITDLYQGIDDKKSVCSMLLEQKGLGKNEVCCIGDDLPDIPMFECSGLPVAVRDAAEEVREAACYVTKNRGGKGAVREVCEVILKAKGLWPGIVSDFKGSVK